MNNKEMIAYLEKLLEYPTYLSAYEKYDTHTPLSVTEIVYYFKNELFDRLTKSNLSLLPCAVDELLLCTTTWQQYTFLMCYVDECLIINPCQLYQLIYTCKEIMYNEPEWQCIDLLHYALVNKRFLYAGCLLQAGVPPYSLHLPDGGVLTVEELSKI